MYTARFLPNDSEDQSQTGFHSIFYTYCAFLPDSTPTLSPTLDRAAQAVSPEKYIRDDFRYQGFNPDRAAQAVSPLVVVLVPYGSIKVSIPTGPPRPFRR